MNADPKRKPHQDDYDIAPSARVGTKKRRGRPRSDSNPPSTQGLSDLQAFASAAARLLRA